MRTTLTLDEDVAATLKAEARRSGRLFRAVGNDVLRRGLASKCDTGPRFTVIARDLGKLRPRLSLDSASHLIEHVDGPLHR